MGIVISQSMPKDNTGIKSYSFWCLQSYHGALYIMFLLHLNRLFSMPFHFFKQIGIQIYLNDSELTLMPSNAVVLLAKVGIHAVICFINEKLKPRKQCRNILKFIIIIPFLKLNCRNKNEHFLWVNKVTIIWG